MHTIELFAYIGPETIVPATSFLAAIGGVLLLFGRILLRPFVWLFSLVRGKKPEQADDAKQTNVANTNDVGKAVPQSSRHSPSAVLGE